MEVSVEKTSELSRKMTIIVAEDVIQSKIASRLQSVASTAKVDGFRPGKVPKSVIKKMYGTRVREEVTGDLIQINYFAALKEQDLQPAGMPHIDVNKNGTDQGLEFTATFEVYPEISLDAISGIEVTQAISSVGDSDIEVMIDKLRSQRAIFEESDQAAKDTDQVTISFAGVCNGENFTEGTIDDFGVIIGSNRMIAGFEAELIGLETGAKKSFDITFPDDYANADLSGQVASFDIEVTKVENSVLPEIDEDFIKTYGVESGNADDFRADVVQNMQRELNQALETKFKSVVMNALFDTIEVALPTALIDQEVESLMKPYKENLDRQNIEMGDADLPAKEAFEERAGRRVALGLILSEISQKNEITANADKVRNVINEMAESYEDPEEVINWYYSDNKRLEEVEQKVLEDSTVAWVVERIKVTEETVAFSDVLEPAK